MKVLAMYLPQYHETKENNEWWGKGYTEWSAVKKAKPLLKGHKQPVIPLGNKYYDLVKNGIETWKWQAQMAQKYGIYGFCIYHYWFTGKQLLEKPMEILRDNTEIDIKYCICWANETWTKTWYDLDNVVLMKQEYGGPEEWKRHFEYLLTFFKDIRYIKINNKPVINIYHTKDIEQLDKMLKVWNDLAKINGFSGIYVVSGNTAGKLEDRKNLIDAYYNFEPGYTLRYKWKGLGYWKYMLRTSVIQFVNKISKRKYVEHIINGENVIKYLGQTLESGDKIKTYYGAFPRWDNTPRRQYKGYIYTHMTPDLFEKQLNIISKKVENEDDFVYINAWNEWGEGAMLEPEMDYKYEYLKKIKKIVKNR